MKRFRIIVALSLSVLLIGGTLWTKFRDSATASVALTSSSLNYDSPAEELAAYNKASGENLNQTELMSRKLVADYFALKASGKATPDNIAKLGAQYGNELFITGTHSSVGSGEIRVAEDSNEHLSAYYRSLMETRARHKKVLDSSFQENEFKDVFASDFSQFMKLTSKEYMAIAQELLKMPVPKSLAENHLALINNYLAGSELAALISEIESNPAPAFAAFESQFKTGEQEEALVANVKVFLLSKGLSTSL